MISSFRPFARAFLVSSLGVVLLAGTGCGRKTPAPLPPGERPNLRPGASWRHAIRGGERQSFHFLL